MTIPIKEVIPREVPANVKPIIDWFADTLDETVNFGSNVIYWDNPPKTKGEENVAPTMLFRHFLDLLDSISILVRQATGDPAKILARAAFEAVLYSEYMFEKDTNDRAMAFLVEDTIRQIKSVNKINPNTQAGKETHKLFKDENLLANLDVGSISVLDDFIRSKLRMLNLPQFKKAYEEYERLKAIKDGNAKWYKYFNGPATIEKLAAHLKQKTLYEIIYRKWSGSVHGTDIYLGKLTSPENYSGIDIAQIRFIKDVQEVVGYLLILSFKLYRLFIQNRMPEKLPDYTDWRQKINDSFLKIMKKQYIEVS